MDHEPMEERRQSSYLTDDEHERLVRVEMRVESLLKVTNDTHSVVSELRKEYTKARGTVAGIVFAVSAMWGFIIMMWRILEE